MFATACRDPRNLTKRQRSSNLYLILDFPRTDECHLGMQISTLPRYVRAALESAPDAFPITDLLSYVDEFVLECSSSPEAEVLLFHLEEELQQIHHDVVDHASIYQTEIFLAILYHLGPILPCTSVVSWFDVVLRPALREPRLPTLTINHAKELIISALQKTEQVYQEKVGDFRRRLFDLYLLDAYNESSGDDVLEWADLDSEQREKRTHWKLNLEDILLRYGAERPQDLFTEIYVHFANPGSRLQLLMLLNLHTSTPYFDTSPATLATHPLMASVLMSLILDNSSTVCSAALTLLVKLLPIFAVHARGDLKAMLPKLLAVLARLLHWKERLPSGSHSLTDEPPDPEFEQELERENNHVLPIRPDLRWERLELTFNATPSSPPSPRPYFTMLYYLYPSNVLKFLSGPGQYLLSSGVASPYTLDWDKAIAENEIRRKSERLIREHVCHPLLIWRDASAELSEIEFWAHYDVSRITSEAIMLDVRSSALGISTKLPADASHNDEQPVNSPAAIRPIDLSTTKTTISLDDMINTSIALKSNLNVEVQKPSAQWSSALFPPTRQSHATEVVAQQQSSDNRDVPPHIIQVISSLQREILLLRNELNFEQWLSRENVKHIGRLYEDRVLTKSAENERQGLYNKLRKYRAEVIRLEAELRDHKKQASSAKDKYADWNTELQQKLKELREEKKSWVSEASALRSAEKEAQARFTAQGKLLAEASKKVFELETQKKENQHKIDRLHDYETQIEQHLNLQRLWDSDFAEFNDAKEQMKLMQSQYKKMELCLESYENTQTELTDHLRVSRRQIQSLEAQLSQVAREARQARYPTEAEIAAFELERSEMIKANKKLRGDNNLLKDELEELRAMIEVLKGRRGLVSERKPSPLSQPHG